MREKATGANGGRKKATFVKPGLVQAVNNVGDAVAVNKRLYCCLSAKKRLPCREFGISRVTGYWMFDNYNVENRLTRGFIHVFGEIGAWARMYCDVLPAMLYAMMAAKK